MSIGKVKEFRGCEGLVIAPVLVDTKEKLEYGPVTDLAPAGSIVKETETSTDTKSYDNVPAIVISSEGADTISLETAVVGLKTLATVVGKYYDDVLGVYVDEEGTPKEFALGYRTQATDGSERLVWRFKGTFSIPPENHTTKKNDTDSSGQSFTYTGISTTHKFTKTTKSAKGIVIDTEDTKAKIDDFFDEVKTIDTLEVKS